MFAHEIAVTGLARGPGPGPRAAAHRGRSRDRPAAHGARRRTAPGGVDATRPPGPRRSPDSPRRSGSWRPSAGGSSVAGVASAPLATWRPRSRPARGPRAAPGRQAGRDDRDATGAALRGTRPSCRRRAERSRPSGRARSLDHGDLSAAQVIVGEMGPVILDWSDATITHPFLAAASFLSTPDDGRDARPTSIGLAAASSSGRGATTRSARLGSVEPAASRPVVPGSGPARLEQPWEMERVVPARLTDLLLGARHCHARVGR